MARKKKEQDAPVENELINASDELPVNEGWQSDYSYEPTFFDESGKSLSIQSETEFLLELLTAQESGNWHGPAAGMIRQRLKLLNGE